MAKPTEIQILKNHIDILERDKAVLLYALRAMNTIYAGEGKYLEFCHPETGRMVSLKTILEKRK